MSTTHASKVPGRHADVVLVSMPFGPVFSPSIGLSLLKAELAARHIPAAIRYFTIPFAEQVGQAFYSDIADGRRPHLQMLAGEWMFARALFPDRPPDDDEAYIDQILERHGEWAAGRFSTSVTAARIRRLRDARRRVDTFLDMCADQLSADRPQIVGFTSVFQQHVASLALARRLKERHPEIAIVLGGANCEGVMGVETIRQFPFVDAVVSGEGDIVFPELVRRLLAAEPLTTLRGVRTRANAMTGPASGPLDNAEMVRNLDDLPEPDFSDYFDQFAASRFRRTWQPSIFFETSRGCWWGERMHCTFCGLNGTTMTFRSKSPRRAIDELVSLTERHPDCDVEVVDNILDMAYFKDVLPELARRRLPVSLFYETKSNLKKDQVRLLRASGIRRIQPGIESFSDTVLKVMRKGVSAAQNIQLLKWCKELGVEPFWNFLLGFPGEPPDEYRRMAELIPLLSHLKPPVGFAAIRLDRFSPNFNEATRLGLVDVAPLPSYRYLYPLTDEAVANLAYYFTFRYRDDQDVGRYSEPAVRAIRAWKKAEGQSELFSVDTGTDLIIGDFRAEWVRPRPSQTRRGPRARPSPSRSQVIVLRGLEGVLYRLCDSVTDVGQLVRAAAEQPPSPESEVGHGAGSYTPDEIHRRLKPFVERGLLVRDGSRYLALAVPVGEYAPSRRVMKRFYRLVGPMGRPQAASPIDYLGKLIARQPASTT